MATGSHIFRGVNRSFNIVKIPASGNCLFLSVAYYWENVIDETVALELRKMVVSFVSEHWDNYGDALSVVLTHRSTVIHSARQYAAYMNTSGVYGGEDEIVAMSQILPATITIHFRERPHDSPRVYNPGQRLSISLLFSGHLDHGHYEVLLPVTNKRDDLLVPSVDNVGMCTNITNTCDLHTDVTSPSHSPVTDEHLQTPDFHGNEHEFIELEIKHGIVQITEALSYLHNSEHLVHCNICPQSILLTRKGSWKLMGFGFAEKIKDGKEGCTGQAWTTKNPKMAQPDLNYMAPEIQINKKCTPLSDMFSVGMVICAIYNQGKSLINAEHNPSLYVKQLDQMQETFGVLAHKMPLQLVEPVEKMINKDIRYRPTAQLFSLLKYFNDPVVISLHGMDMCDRRDPVQRVEAYSSLSQVVPNIPRKMLYNNVLPELFNECKCLDSMVYALPTLITIIDYATRADYIDVIMPEFRAILANTKPVQATVYILNKLDIILTKSPIDEIKGEVLPFVFNTLDSSSLQAQEAALGAIGVIKEYLDDNILRKVVLPKAKSLFFRSNNVKIRINALTCIDHLLDSLDKMLILDNILPFLANISAQDPDVIMSVVVNFTSMLLQFTSLMEVLREMLEQVDKQRRDKMKLETVTLPVPPRGSLKMMNSDNESDEALGLGSHQAIILETQRAQQIQKVKT
ncbi:hypothetical protein Btru_058578, partial [Bulinus truncatus]